MTPLRADAETPQRRFARALDLERRIEAGASLGEADARWLSIYREGTEYRTYSMLYEDFGDKALAE